VFRHPGRRASGNGPGPNLVDAIFRRLGVGRGPISRVEREMDRYFYVYILTNRRYGTLYVGITNDLVRRVWEHRNNAVPGFTREHELHRLVWYEQHATALEAIRQEKLIKKWHRDWKVNLVQRMNPDWEDLFESIVR
jgi:putative endonuclease